MGRRLYVFTGSVHRPVALGGLCRLHAAPLLGRAARARQDVAGPARYLGGPDGRYALALVLFATWVGMGMLGHARWKRAKRRKSRAGTEMSKGASCVAAPRAAPRRDGGRFG